ncbi:TonB-dependent receptor plug domain-containing protein [Pseudomonas profundi]|uniref:TonB-dependent receptor plug domain-containing protein n=1 Tax=Pseudomonas profundi TaxID=1981513 RepID=UPI001CC247C2|nr:TonB-dependent receptor [Pseudomonas profundi]
MIKTRSLVILLTIAMTGAVQAGEGSPLGNPDLPTVLSATRLRQAPADVPGSMTVIDRELIRASGARDVPELLRLVPGMLVGYHSGNTVNVNYHGTNVSEARRLQVLVDGRSIYRPGFATIDWPGLSLAMEDIERIEVFRGPNTAAYGANALMGVINIVSRDPSGSLGTRLKVTSGTRGVRDRYGSHGFKAGDTHMRLSIIGRRDNGFDHDEDGESIRDGQRSDAFTLSGVSEIDPTQTLEWQLGAADGSRQADYDYEAMAPGNPDYPGAEGSAFERRINSHAPSSDLRDRNWFASARWTNDFSSTHSLQASSSIQHMERLQQWRACDSPVVFSPELKTIYQADPQLARHLNKYFRGKLDDAEALQALFPGDKAALFPLAEEVIAQHDASLDTGPVCWDINQTLRETRYEVELQDTLQLTEQLRTVFGSNLRYDRVRSETYFNGVVDNRALQLFANVEYRPHDQWLLHAAGMAEDSELTGYSFSPRLAVHYFLRPSHSLRAVYSEAVRSPDMYENHASWTYRPTNMNGASTLSRTYYAHAKGPGNLEQEHMRSAELGYNGYSHQLALSMDFRAFHEEIDDMMSEPLQLKNFVPTNAGFVRFTGAEGQLDWQATPTDRLRLTYAYIDFTAAHKLDQRLTPRNSGSVAWLRQWPGGFDSSLIYYGADMLNERRFERVDSRVGKRLELTRSSSLDLALTWQYRLDDEGLTWAENRFDSPSHYYLSAQLSF